MSTKFYNIDVGQLFSIDWTGNLIWILLEERNYVWLCSTDVNASSIKFMFIEISWLNF